MTRLVTIILFVLVSVSRGQVQPVEDAPSVLRLSSGGEVDVLEIFKTTLIETDEPALVLRYQTSKMKEDLRSEAEEVWAAFKPIVEKEKLRVAFVASNRVSGGGVTWIWKQDANGVWDAAKDEDEAITANGLDSPDLISETRKANAIVHLRLILEPTAATDPKYPNLRRPVIQNVLVVQTLKKTPDFLGDAALREACSVWHVGQKWQSSVALNYVDYLVFRRLPVGDFDHGGVTSSFHMLPVTNGVLRNVQRALQLESTSNDARTAD